MDITCTPHDFHMYVTWAPHEYHMHTLIKFYTNLPTFRYVFSSNGLMWTRPSGFLNIEITCTPHDHLMYTTWSSHGHHMYVTWAPHGYHMHTLFKFYTNLPTFRYVFSSNGLMWTWPSGFLYCSMIFSTSTFGALYTENVPLRFSMKLLVTSKGIYKQKQIRFKSLTTRF